ncbi:Hvo_1808 family surface protein [Salinibaculum rarum]|uniref:Hvo_1808 family surface protein n=1 Tax=Salinibaculum rarum TaxID=3058903 RepID=UPI002660129D|nr:Hvo_1808 family surface protein [Salinibaculum sp. KK48]
MGSLRSTGVAITCAALILLTSVGGAVAATTTPTAPQPPSETTDTTTTPPVSTLENSTNNTQTAQQQTAPPDPEEDVIGWENGVWYNESIDVNQSDGLTEAEREAYVSRGMARVEQIRGLEFKKDIPVDVITRSNYRDTQNNQSDSPSQQLYGEWNNQVWEAMLISGEHSDVQKSLKSAYSGAVVGYYSPSDDAIKLIRPSEDATLHFDNATLIHELTHALQDQHFNLERDAYSGDYQDTSLAVDSLVEGDASLVENRYKEHCADDWDCVNTPTTSPPQTESPSSQQKNLGVLFTIYFPYFEGPAYANDYVTGDDWSELNALYRDTPDSTEQIIHRTTDATGNITFTDTATKNWTLIAEREPGLTQRYDVIGEASMYIMFWYQGYKYEKGPLNWRQTYEGGDGRYDKYTYKSPITAGWDADRIYPYSKTSENKTEHGYVWITQWDSENDASEFKTAYKKLLLDRAATQLNDTTIRVETDRFEDAFRVIQDDNQVIIVNAPTVDGTHALRPDLTAPTTDNTTSNNTTTPPSQTETPPQNNDSENAGLPWGSILIGGAVAVVGLLAALYFRRSGNTETTSDGKSGANESVDDGNDDLPDLEWDLNDDK